MHSPLKIQKFIQEIRAGIGPSYSTLNKYIGLHGIPIYFDYTHVYKPISGIIVERKNMDTVSKLYSSIKDPYSGIWYKVEKYGLEQISVLETWNMPSDPLCGLVRYQATPTDHARIPKDGIWELYTQTNLCRTFRGFYKELETPKHFQRV